MIDFDYYVRNYDGKKIEKQSDFESVCSLAEKYVAKATDGRGGKKEIGDAVCAVCDILFEHGGTSGITSEAADGVRISYEQGHCSKLIHNALKLYLPSRLLYRGLM